MAHMWKVGDKAVCVRKGGRGSLKPRNGCGTVKIRGVYEVEGTCSDPLGNVGIVLRGHYSEHPTGGYLADAFRPIVKADDDFIAQMRALKPKVKQ